MRSGRRSGSPGADAAVRAESRAGPPEAGARAGTAVSEAAFHRPPPALRPFVAAYAGYRQAGVALGRHRGLPSPFLTLIITLDEPLVITEHPDPRQPASRHEVLAGGLHTSPALVTHDGRQSGIQLSLTPLGARALLGLPAGALAGIDAEGAEVVGGLAAEWQDRVRAAPGWLARFAVLDEMLSRRAARGGGPGGMRPEVAQAWRTLLASSGTVAVADLARQAGWSTRHLGARFRAETGLSPKAAARVVRFHRARRLLQGRVAAGGDPALARLAAACGYCDQAHLAREFRGLAGCPPSRWIAEEFRNVQAAPPAPAAESLA